MFPSVVEVGREVIIVESAVLSAVSSIVVGVREVVHTGSVLSNGERRE